jgi:hypothetical protein
MKEKRKRILSFHFLKAKSGKNLFCFIRQFILLYRSEKSRLIAAIDLFVFHSPYFQAAIPAIAE